jgi:N-hydroxyarylamine O-acetyltransferase
LLISLVYESRSGVGREIAIVPKSLGIDEWGMSDSDSLVGYLRLGTWSYNEAMIDVSAYLERIHYRGPTGPTAENLLALHRAHMFAVPFENLDIHLGRPILCDADSFLDKIIRERRGGFCYELNGAFAALLTALGFEVPLLSARVARPDGNYGPDFDHLALRVNSPAPAEAASWLAELADVGFGDSFLEPLRMDSTLEQPQIGRIYRVLQKEGGFVLEALKGGPKAEWIKQYSFTPQPRQIGDFAAMCQYHQTSPESYFTRQRICSRATPRGRITLSDLTLIETVEGRREERVLSGEDEWRATLRELFQIDLAT